MKPNQPDPAIPDPLPQDMLHYNPHYRILLCTHCNYAIQPLGLPRHLKEIHQIKRSRRLPFTSYASKFSLATPEQVFATPIHSFPVEGLPVLDGLRCGKEGCGHLCVSEKRMRSHWVAEHGRQGEWCWTEEKLQTFFRGNLLRYFCAGDVTTVVEQLIIPHCPYEKLRSGRGNCVRGQGLTGTHHSTLDASWVGVISSDILVQSMENIHLSLPAEDHFLLKHYVEETASTIATDSATLRLWKEAVPLLAHSHPFLLHGLLALSALHLAHKTPFSSPLHADYLFSAATHQDTAMPIYRSSISSVTTETSHAVFTFSHLLVLYCLASESHDERLFIVKEREDSTPIWLHFLRTGCSVLCDVWDDLEAGPVKSLVASWDIPELEYTLGRTDLVESLLGFIPSGDVWSEEETRVYTDTALLLGRAFTNATHGITFSTWDALRIWPMCITKEYLRLLSEQHAGALILLGHYCVLLKKLEGNWYFEGRATGLLRNVLECLESKWMFALKAPMEEIGLVVDAEGVLRV